MIHEHQRVVLEGDVLEQGLRTGDVGTVVHVYSGSQAYEVEFVGLSGDSETIVTLKANQVRPVRKHEIAHARQLVEA